MTKGRSIYKSYLLRMWWQEKTGLCRISLEEVREESSISYFADIASLTRFLIHLPEAETENKQKENE